PMESVALFCPRRHWLQETGFDQSSDDSARCSAFPRGGLEGLADKTRTDRRQVEDIAAFQTPGRGDCYCGIRVGTQSPAIEDDKLAVEREILARQAAQWQAFGMQGLDQACAFELVDVRCPDRNRHLHRFEAKLRISGLAARV